MSDSDPAVASRVLGDPTFGALRDHLQAATGLACCRERESELAAHVSGRLRQLCLDGCAEYLRRLQAAGPDDEELGTLATRLTVGETFFFRFREQFDALATHVLPALIAANATTRRLRVWSAGCATGPEPYSLAILLHERFPDVMAGWDVTILGTDINAESLAQARRGGYRDHAFRQMDRDRLNAWFERRQGLWHLRPALRRHVVFRRHNLVQPPPQVDGEAPAFDLILCRNVIIYFDADTTRRLIGTFHRSLRVDGWLLLGHAEQLPGQMQGFTPVPMPGAFLYRRDEALAGGVTPEVCRGRPTATSAGEALPLAPAPSLPAAATPPARAPAPTALAVEAPAPAALRAEPPPSRRSDLDEIRRVGDGGHPESAVQLLDAALSSDRLDPALHLYRAILLDQLGRRDEALGSLRAALFLDHRSALAHYWLGVVATRARQPAEARRAFRNALQLARCLDPAALLDEHDGLRAGDLAQLAGSHLELVP